MSNTINRRVFDILSSLLELNNEETSLNFIKQYSIKDLFINSITSADKKISEFLIKNGADVNQDMGWSDESKIIHVIIRNGYKELFMLLLKYGVNTTSKTKSFHTPIAISIIHRRNEIFDELLKYEKNINHVDNDGNSLLHLAVQSNNKYIVDKLLENDINIDIKNSDGMIASYYGFQNEINRNGIICRKLTVLLSSRVSAKECYDNYKDSQDEIYSFAINNNYDLVVAFLLENGCKTNTIIDKKINATDLHIAAQKGYSKIVELLLKYGADVAAKTIYFHTPISLAIQENHLQCFFILIEKEKDINHVDVSGNSLLHFATGRNTLEREEMVETLLEKGIDIDIKNKYNKLAQDGYFTGKIENYRKNVHFKFHMDNSKRFLKLAEIFKNIGIDLNKIPAD